MLWCFFLTFNTNIGFDPQTRTNLCERLFPMQANAVLHGEIWRLFTATYMHASFPHIFMNMLILYFFGPLMERRLGGKQFFYMYTLGGIAGNILLTLAGLVNFINPTHIRSWGIRLSMDDHGRCGRVLPRMPKYSSTSSFPYAYELSWACTPFGTLSTSFKKVPTSVATFATSQGSPSAFGGQ